MFKLELPSIELSVFASIGAFFAFLHAKQQSDLALFRELFKDFNSRYDALNECINRIRNREDGVPLCGNDRANLCDYFNLCAEEYFYFESGYIDKRVWHAWRMGMMWFAEDVEIREFWELQLETDSYYGFSLD